MGMKSQRQAKILEIIGQRDIETQEQLLTALEENGFRSTQATISRDIKDLRIVKELSDSGSYRYTVQQAESATFVSRLNNIFHECVIKLDHAQNIVVIHTLPGLASAACSAVDSMACCLVERMRLRSVKTGILSSSAMASASRAATTS